MITILIIATTCLLSILAWNNPETLEKCMLNPVNVIKKKEFFRLITSGFVHKDTAHLVFNMLSLFFFGPELENSFKAELHYGGTVFVLFYLFAIVVSDIPTLIKERSNRHYNSLGASGGVSSVLFSYVILNPMAKIYLYAIIGLPAFAWGALFLIYSAWQSKNAPNSGINHDAHLYGALFGMLFSLLAFKDAATNFLSNF
jgi:membrane associated rhomboid family serine protease